MAHKPSNRALTEFLSRNTGLARIGTWDNLKKDLKEAGLGVDFNPAYAINLITDDLEFYAYSRVDVLPPVGEEGMFYILPSGAMTIWDSKTASYITTGEISVSVDAYLNKNSLNAIANKPVALKFEEIEAKLAVAGSKVFFVDEALDKDIADTTVVQLANIVGATADDIILDKTFVYDAEGTMAYVTAFNKLTGKVSVTTTTIVGGSGELLADITVNNPIGRYKNGDVIPAGTGFETIFRGMLTNVYYPTLTNPSATLTYTFDQYVKVGVTVTAKTATVGLNRGSINPQYTAASPYRSGAATNYSIALVGADSAWSDSSASSGTFTVPAFTKSSTGAVTLTGTVAYAAGVQPKDSDGNNYNSPLPAGSVSTTKTINFILPFVYGASNTSTISDFTGLTENITPKGQKKFKYTTNNQYMVFAYDAAYGNLTSILDPNSFETISGWTKSSLTVGGQNYNVYIADAATTDTNAEFTFKF